MKRVLLVARQGRASRAQKSAALIFRLMRRTGPIVIRWTAVLIALALVAGACGDDASDVPGADGVVDVGPGVDVAAEIAYLGSLAELASDPIVIAVDASPATIELSDGALLDVSENSFGEPTALTVGIADIDLGRFELDGPTGRLYVVGTPEDMELAEPVTLELPGPPDGRHVFQYHDGTWSEVEPAAGEVTVVPIRGFSTVQTAVINGDIAAPTGSPALPNGDTPAQYLRNCMFALGSWYAEAYPGDEFSNEKVLITSDFATNQAAYLCTTALIDRLSPSDQYVSVACVGDRIEELGGLDAAIAACAESDDNDQPADGTNEIAENAADEGDVDGSTDDATSAGTSAATPTTPLSEPAPDEGAEPASWTGTIELDEVGGTLVDSYVGIERLADGSYTLSAYIESTRESIGCFWVELQTAEGTGQLSADGTRIEFEIEYTSDVEPSGAGCAGGSEVYTADWPVDIDGDTLSGSIFSYTIFSISR